MSVVATYRFEVKKAVTTTNSFAESVTAANIIKARNTEMSKVVLQYPDCEVTYLGVDIHVTEEESEEST